MEPLEDGQTRTQYLVDAAHKHFPLFLSQNNHKGAIQFAIPLTIQCNQESQMAKENAKRRRIRKSTEADETAYRKYLRSHILRVMETTGNPAALDEVQQMAYLLTLITVSKTRLFML